MSWETPPDLPPIATTPVIVVQQPVDVNIVNQPVNVNIVGGLMQGQIVEAGALEGDGSGVDYSTTSATFVDVDATNLKVFVTVPTNARFIIVGVNYSVEGSVSVDGLAKTQILAAGSAVALSAYGNNGVSSPIGTYTAFGVVSNPTAGVQSIAFQFRGDGVNAFTIFNRAVEGTPAGNVIAGQVLMSQVMRTRMFYIVTS